jgi:hypothetical protein
METQKEIVKFKKSYQPYAVGELAGFSSDTASKLVAKGIAERHVTQDTRTAQPGNNRQQTGGVQK